MKKLRTMTLITYFTLLSVTIILGTVPGHSAAGEENLKSLKVPLPEVVKIIPPSDKVPKEIAAFSGVWDGVWSGGLEGALIVEEIDSEEAMVIYSWGELPKWKIRKGYERVRAKVIHSGKKPRIEFGSGERPKFVFTMGEGLKNIKGTRNYKGYHSFITMHKSE